MDNLIYHCHFSAGSQVCRTFHPTFHPWISESAKMRPPSNWMTPISTGKPLSHTNPAGLLSAHPSGSLTTASSNSHVLCFPPTPPKDGTPEMNSLNTAEYTHDSKSNDLTLDKDSSSPNPAAETSSLYGTSGFLSSCGANHTVPNYNYSDCNNHMFHPASMLKAGISRPRSKNRTSSGQLLLNKSKHMWYISECIQ